MAKDLERILRCPITGGDLGEMNRKEIGEVNRRIARRGLFHSDGTPVEREIESGFVSSDGRFAYPIANGIVVLLPTLAFVLDAPAGKPLPGDRLRREKEVVRDFYDQLGWQQGGDGFFLDALRFEDLRPVAKDYVHKCHLRVQRYLKPGGKYLLDVASGPIQFPEYLAYSEGYERRICVDISLLALREAKRKLKDKGIYLLADIVNLPLKNNVADGVLSVHTIYHVPEDEQATAFRELYRVLRPQCKAVVAYSWGCHSLLMNIAFSPTRLRAVRAVHHSLRRLRAVLTSQEFAESSDRNGRKDAIQVPRSSSESPMPDLYFHPHDYGYFARTPWEFTFDLAVWRSVSVPFTKTYIHPRLFGRQILGLIYWLEERFPALAGRFGQYPLFVIEKQCPSFPLSTAPAVDRARHLPAQTNRLRRATEKDLSSRNLTGEIGLRCGCTVRPDEATNNQKIGGEVGHADNAG